MSSDSYLRCNVCGRESRDPLQDAGSRIHRFGIARYEVAVARKEEKAEPSGRPVIIPADTSPISAHYVTRRDPCG